MPAHAQQETPVVWEILSDLEKGIEGAELGMNKRDQVLVWHACKAYLGRDVLAAQKDAEFLCLPAETRDTMRKSGQLGEYGVQKLYCGQKHPEVTLALKIRFVEAVRDIEGDGAGQQAFKRLLGRKHGGLNKKTLEAVSARFTDLPRTRIAKAITFHM